LVKKFATTLFFRIVGQPESTTSSQITMKMGPRATRNCVIVDFCTSVPLVLSLINDIYDVDEMRLLPSLSSKDIAFVTGASSGRRQIFGAEASLEIHFWKSAASAMPAFSIIVNLPTHWSVRMYMAALFVTVKKTSALVPRKVDEAWGSVSGSFITINEVAFLYPRETDNILDIIKRSNGFAYIKGGV
jgi:hypothetical protein